MNWLDRIHQAQPPAGGHSIAEQMAAAYDAAARGDYKTALEIWGPLSHAGIARAQNNVGACFAEGLGVERDADIGCALARAFRRSRRCGRPTQSCCALFQRRRRRTGLFARR